MGIPRLRALALACLFHPFVTHAASLDIQFAGFNFVYDGSDIFDAASSNTTRTGNPADADPLTAVSFFVDGSQVGSTLTTDIYLDLYINDVLNIDKNGDSVQSGGNGNDFGIDLLTNSTTPGFGLAVDIDKVQVDYIVASAGSLSIEVAIVGAGIGAINQQDLPFGLVLDEFDIVTFVLSSTSFSTTDDGTNLTGFTASGTGTITGTVIPLPASVWLLGSGLLGLVGVARRKK